MTPGLVHDVGATVVPFAAASPAFAALGLDLPLRHPQLALAHPLEGGRAVIVDRNLDVTADALGADASRYRRVIAPLVRHFDALADATLAPATRQARHPIVAARFGPLALLPGTALARLFSTEEAKAVITGLASHATVPASHPLTAGVGLTLLGAAHAVGWPMVEGGSWRAPARASFPWGTRDFSRLAGFESCPSRSTRCQNYNVHPGQTPLRVTARSSTIVFLFKTSCGKRETRPLSALMPYLMQEIAARYGARVLLASARLRRSPRARR